MPSGVGAARRRAARVLTAAALALTGVVVASAPAHAQAAPTGGLQIEKVEIGGIAPATFVVTGVDVDFAAQLEADVTAQNVPTPATPTLVGLAPGTYQIQETAPIDPTDSGLSVWDLVDVDCGAVPVTFINSSTVQITIADSAVTCTFTDAVTRASTQGVKVVRGDTSSWVRPAVFHISCPAIQVEIDIPVGPGAPGSYTIGQGSLPPTTCTFTEVDTGSDGPVEVSMVVWRNNLVIATGARSVTFSASAGDTIVIVVTNTFPSGGGGGIPDGGATTTTTPGGGSTTTVPGGGGSTTTVPGGGGSTTTVPGGGGSTTTTPNGGGSTTTVPGGGGGGTPTTAPQLPTTGAPTAGLIVAALTAMIVGLVLVARSRRFAD